MPSGCRTHIRVFSWVRKHDYDQFRIGYYLKDPPFEPGSAEESRRRYFLDAWNSPYWIRHVCGKRTDKAFIYSFEPNRRRDSDRKGIKGDDVGVVFSMS